MKVRRAGFLTLFVALSVLLCGCPRSDLEPGGGSAGDDRINVVTTVGMIADAAENVGGDRVEVTALMGPGVDPHYYKATAGDVSRLNDADIIFYGGLELEGRMTEIFEKLSRSGKPTVPVSRDIPTSQLRQPKEFQGRYDPHIWFDVTLWQQAVKTVATHLGKVEPNNAPMFQANAETYNRKLDDLHRYVKTEIARIPESQRVLITAHDAFGYFGRQYGVEVRGLQGISTTSEAGAKDVRDLADFIVQRKIKAIFVESSVPRATIEAVQKAVQSRGGKVAIGGQLFSDAMGQAGTDEGTYIGMVRHNVDTMVRALK